MSSQDKEIDTFQTFAVYILTVGCQLISWMILNALWSRICRNHIFIVNVPQLCSICRINSKNEEKENISHTHIWRRRLPLLNDQNYVCIDRKLANKIESENIGKVFWLRRISIFASGICIKTIFLSVFNLWNLDYVDYLFLNHKNIQIKHVHKSSLVRKYSF